MEESMLQELVMKRDKNKSLTERVCTCLLFLVFCTLKH
uniref:Uncharacterized protein n=1 Tax=Arundo donax TaxID=35708 RepID=A0A0A9GG41_ARUDO